MIVEKIDDKTTIFFKVPSSAPNLEVYITESVKGSSRYIELGHELRQLQNSSIVNFYISNYGGDCHGLISLISAIKTCKAKEKNMIVVSPSYSAASTLALCGTSLRFEPYTFLMFHNYSSCQKGKGGELLQHIQAADKWLKDYFRNIHSPFLNDIEITEMNRDQDIYVHYKDKDLKRRIKRHFKISR